MAEIKDKKISVYTIDTERDADGNEIKVKHYIHGKNRLWAYVRELTDKEKFTAKAAGSEQSTAFKVSYNERIKAGLYLEFHNDTFIIESVGGFEFYKRDLIIRAVRAVAEVTVDEVYDE